MDFVFIQGWVCAWWFIEERNIEIETWARETRFYIIFIASSINWGDNHINHSIYLYSTVFGLVTKILLYSVNEWK